MISWKIYLRKLCLDLGISNITPQERNLIENDTDYPVLQKWYSKLSGWEWPNELLPEEKPNEFDRIPGRRRELLKLIEKKIGRKYILRIHNKLMTEENFEDFWQAMHNGNRFAYERYMAKLKELTKEFQSK
jgi:hypothetical protein